jgi:hypothetical protein
MAVLGRGRELRGDAEGLKERLTEGLDVEMGRGQIRPQIASKGATKT